MLTLELRQPRSCPSCLHLGAFSSPSGEGGQRDRGRERSPHVGALSRACLPSFVFRAVAENEVSRDIEGEREGAGERGKSQGEREGGRGEGGRGREREREREERVREKGKEGEGKEGEGVR
jgi:hypothetical protein